MKTYKVYQYRPAYFSGFENRIDEISNKEEFLELSYIKTWADDPTVDYICLSEDKNHAMAVTKRKEWWVMAKVDKDINSVLNLPIIDIDKIKHERKNLKEEYELYLSTGIKGDSPMFIKLEIKTGLTNKSLGGYYSVEYMEKFILSLQKAIDGAKLYNLEQDKRSGEV